MNQSVLGRRKGCLAERSLGTKAHAEGGEVVTGVVSLGTGCWDGAHQKGLEGLQVLGEGPACLATGNSVRSRAGSARQPCGRLASQDSQPRPQGLPPWG